MFERSTVASPTPISSPALRRLADAARCTPMLMGLLVLLVVSTPRASEAKLKYELRTDLDNDAFTDFTSDENYSWGARISFHFPAPRRFFCLDGDYQTRTGVCVLRRAGGFDFRRLRFVVAIGQMFWTPDEIEFRAIRPQERPWAGLAYIGLGFEYETPTWRLTGELMLGFTGNLSGARYVQVWWHKFVPAPTQPWGWDHQIGEELIVNLRLRYERRFFTEATRLRTRLGTHHWFDASLTARAALGTFWGHVAGGFGFRIGYISHGFSAARVFAEQPADRKHGKRDEGRFLDFFQVYFFARFEAAHVFRDATLQGALFAPNPHTVQMIRWVPHAQIGLKFDLKYVDLHYSAVFVGPEVDTPAKRDDWHLYGQIWVGYQFY
ncbi:MAG: lipid A deacylase LpxR family protein [Myxococcales bacterium]|nr:lipid A deacylase LpxR family protein [Myxococcales bacterium]